MAALGLTGELPIFPKLSIRKSDAVVKGKGHRRGHGLTPMTESQSRAALQDFDYIIQTGKDGRLDDAVSPHSHVVDLLDRAIGSRKTIVLHLHGGLVPKESAYEMVNHLQPRYVEQGLFPIFIVWRTGLFDAVKNAAELVHRPLFERLLIRLIKHFVARYGSPEGRALGPGEEPDDAEIEEELKKRNVGEIPYDDVHPEPDQEEMSKAEEGDLAASIQGDEELKDQWVLEVKAPEAPPGGKALGIDDSVRDEALLQDKKPEGRALASGIVLAEHAVKIAARIIKRYFKRRDHGLHTTVVEEILRELYVDLIGTEVWQFMKQDSADTFEAKEKFHERGGRLLMQLMGEAVKKRRAAGEPLPKVSIVGHSAGSIYAGNILAHLAKERGSNSSAWFGLPFQFEKLVFLAPAATCKTFSTVLSMHAKNPLFQVFRMYSLSDEIERGYYEVPVLYPGSLLYIISGLLESEDDAGTHDMPIVGMQRYARSTHPFSEPVVAQVWKFLNKHPDQLVWSGDERGAGLNCDSKKHGDFFRTPETVASFLHFLG